MEYTVEEWKKLVTYGVEYKEEYGMSKRWDDFRSYLRGEFPAYKDTQGKLRLLPFNITYAMLHTIVPNVYFKNPYVTVTPRFKHIVDGQMSEARDINARIVEGIDNWLPQELGLKQQMKAMAADAFICGVGIGKLVYDSQFGFSSKNILPELKDATLTALDKKKREIIEYNELIKPGMPGMLRVDPKAFIVPFGTHYLKNCRWVDHVVLRTLEDVKGDSKYKNTKDLAGSHLLVFKRETGFFQKLSSIQDVIEIHEIRDVKTKQVFAFSPASNDFLRAPDTDELQIDGLPYVSLTFNDDPEFFWAVPDAAIMEPQQLELNEARTQSMIHRRLALLKFLVEDTAISDEELAKFLSGDIGVAVKVKGTLANAIQQVQPHIPPDFYLYFEAILGDVRTLLGFGRNRMGEVEGSSRRTATEASIAASSGDLRLDERRDAMGECFGQVMRKLNQSIFKFWDVGHVIQIIGQEGARYWIKIKGTALLDEYDLKVDVESLSPISKETKKREMAQMVGALAKNPNANVTLLMHQLLRQYDWADAMSILPEAPQTTPGTPLSQEDFIKQQMTMRGKPRQTQLKQNIQRTAETLGG